MKTNLIVLLFGLLLAPALGSGIQRKQQPGSLRKAYGHHTVLSAEPVHDVVIKEGNETVSKLMHMDPYQMFLDDLTMMRDTLMPGKQPNFGKKLLEVSIVVLALAWYAVYMSLFYEDDRCTKIDRWDQASLPHEHAATVLEIEVDVVLVFHKPDFEYPDKDTAVSGVTLENALARTGDFRRSEALLPKQRSRRSSLLTSLTRGLSFRKQTGDVSQDESPLGEDESASAITENSVTTLGDIRKTLLQDICEHFPESGFDVRVFTSIDGDEIFVCIGLNSGTTIKQHVSELGMRLQLQSAAVQELDISQPPHEAESSPPYVRYDRMLAGNVFGSMQDLDIFENHGGGTGNGWRGILSGSDRVRIIQEQLHRSLNLDYAVEKNLLVKWYPAHLPERVDLLQKCWARWGLLTDLSVRQPLPLIKDYFGSRVAFLFAWTGLYSKMMLCLLPVSILFLSLNIIASLVGKTGLWHRGSVMGFGLAVVIWSRMAWNLWQREEGFLRVLWDLGYVDKDKTERPDFSGTLMPDLVDGNKKSLQYSSWKYTLRVCISWMIVLVFCTFVFCCEIVLLDHYQGRMDIGASVVQAIMIQIFTLIFNFMAEALTQSENHQYQKHYYTSYSKKMFIFQLINQYSGFFYMAIKQQFTPAGCPDGGCVYLLQGALPMTLTVLAAMQIVLVVVASWIVKLSLFIEKWQMKRTELVHDYLEEQAKYGPFGVREQIEFMTQMILTLGYVLIFGCVAPRIVPLCFLVFVVMLRAKGVLMTTVVHRTIPHETVGIGPWSEAIYFLMLLGVLFSAYLLVQFGPLFKATTVLTKLTGMFLYCFVVGLLWVCVDLACPPSDSRTELLENRRQAVEQLVMHTHERQNYLAAQRKQTDRIAVDTFFVDEVLDANWEAVPKLVGENECK